MKSYKLRRKLMFDANVGKPTCFFLQLWFLQYCIQAVDMISACIIIYRIHTIYVQQLCYVEGQQCCCQEAVGGTRLEREKVEWREGGGEQRGNVSFNTLILYQTCASHRVWTHCLNPMCELTSSIDLENHVPIWEIKHRFGKPCSILGIKHGFGKPCTHSGKPCRFNHACSHLDTQHWFGCQYPHVGHPTTCCILWLMLTQTTTQQVMLNKYVEHKMYVSDLMLRSVGPLGIYIYTYYKRWDLALGALAAMGREAMSYDIIWHYIVK